MTSQTKDNKGLPSRICLVKCPDCKRLVIRKLVNRGCWIHGELHQIKAIFNIKVEYQPEKYYTKKRKRLT